MAVKTKKRSTKSKTKAKTKTKTAKKTAKTRSTKITYTLDESMDITRINQFYSEMSKLHARTKVVINAGKLKRIDTSGIQLLCSWYIEAKKKGIDVSWKNQEGTLLDSANLLGLTATLELLPT